MVYLVNELIESYRKDGQANPKRKPTNNAIIEMLEYCDLSSLDINPTKSLQVANRGEVVECLVKYQVYEFLGLDKSVNLSKCKALDLDLRKYDKNILNELGLDNSTYEIKFTSPLANASIKNNKTKKCLIVNVVEKFGKGVYLVESKNLIKNGSNHITAESVKNGYYLGLLSDLLGL